MLHVRLSLEAHFPAGIPVVFPGWQPTRNSSTRSPAWDFGSLLHGVFRPGWARYPRGITPGLRTSGRSPRQAVPRLARSTPRGRSGSAAGGAAGAWSPPPTSRRRLSSADVPAASSFASENSRPGARGDPGVGSTKRAIWYARSSPFSLTPPRSTLVTGKRQRSRLGLTWRVPRPKHNQESWRALTAQKVEVILWQDARVEQMQIVDYCVARDFEITDIGAWVIPTIRICSSSKIVK